MNIFISYTVRDGYISKDFLRFGAKLLSDISNPYIDILHNSSLFPQLYVTKMLKNATLFCACISPFYIKSEWVRYEIAIARKRNLPVVSLIIDGNASTDALWSCLKHRVQMNKLESINQVANKALNLTPKSGLPLRSSSLLGAS